MSELMGKVIKELEHVFDVLKSAIYINRQRIVELEKRIKELEKNKLDVPIKGRVVVTEEVDK